jgi:hypothetical protein
MLYLNTAMTHRLPVTRRLREDRKAKEIDISETGEPHDPTNGDGDNQDGENKVPWTPTYYLQLDQDDQVT